MSKTPGWQTRLLTTVKELSSTPFSWGKNDCCTFAAKCVDAQYGTDIYSEIVGKYSTELGSKKFTIQKVGTTHLPALLDIYLGERIEKNFAQRGDVVTFEGDLGLTAGILWTGFVWAMGPNGVVTFPINKIKITDVWRV